MKVLFAVSSEEISEKIIKRYQKEYKEILSYKNVYYFNAILKEIQKDKTYDRIVISEDLEPLANNNYDTIDKFIFDRLDSISDEAHDNQGKETSIILICTERRTKGSSILLKLFGIGIYNALLGNDRSMEQVCKLINRPRGKKEAKQYYQIDTEDVNYRAENENEVSELEIQNILTHFKKLGRNTDRYADSFNNIAAQYTEEQLKIIINCLPINVKAVLEERSPKYQEIMSVTGGARVNIPPEQKLKNAGLRIDNIQNVEKPQMNGPIVIPSTIRTSKTSKSPNIQGENVRTINRNVATPQVNTQQPRRVVQSNINAQRPVENTANNVQNNIPNMEQPVRNIRANQPQNVVTPNQVPNANANMNQMNRNVEPQQSREVVKENQDMYEDMLPGIEDTQEPVKKGRGRPRKITNVEEENKPKARRGRPRKVVEETASDVLPGLEETDDTLLPGVEDFELPGMEPEIPEVQENNDSNVINNNYNNQTQTANNYDEDDLSSLLPGLEDDELSYTDNTQSNNAQSFNNTQNVQQNPVQQPTETIQPVDNTDDLSSLLPEMNFDDEQDYTDEVSLPGLDELDDLDSSDDFNNDSINNQNNQVVNNSYVQNNQQQNQNTNSFGNEEVEDYEDFDDGLLPGLDSFDMEDNNYDNNEETMLPGMGFEDDVDDLIPSVTPQSNNVNPANNNPQQHAPAHSYTVKSGGLRSRNLLNNQKNNNQMYENNYNDNNLQNDYSNQYQDNSSVDYNNSQNINNNYNNTYNNDYTDNSYQNNYGATNSQVESLKPKVDYSMSSLNSLLTQDKKIVTFIGSTKNGTSFLVNNLASMFSSLNINTAILDMTKNRNSYYIYTKNEEELRKIAYNSMEKLENGYAEGIKVDRNLTVYTALPNDGKTYTNAEAILSTLVQNHSIVLIDCDFDTDAAYFASCQEIYLVQSLDILTIQPLTAFLRDLKTKGVLEPEKVRVVINKELKVGSLTAKTVIGGMSFYNDPAMSFMTELFNKDMVKYCVIPFDEKAYSKYLEAIVECKVSHNSYPSNFINKLKTLGDMVYPLTSKQSYGRQTNSYSKPNNGFSSSMNNTLNKMKKKY